MNNSDAESVVQGQVEAYNAHDVEKFVGYYDDDVSIYDLSSNKPPTQGTVELKKAYDWLAKAPVDYRVEIVQRIVNGSIIVDLERVYGLPNGEEPEVLAVYEVQKDKIVNVWFPPSP